MHLPLTTLGQIALGIPRLDGGNETTEDLIGPNHPIQKVHLRRMCMSFPLIFPLFRHCGLGSDVLVGLLCALRLLAVSGVPGGAFDTCALPRLGLRRLLS